MVKILEPFSVKIKFTSFFILFPLLCFSQQFNFNGQISSWLNTNKIRSDWESKIGFRFIPQLNLYYQFENSHVINTELMINTNYESNFNSDGYSLNLYRAILRYTTEQTETQVGLQKINFGSAQLLRPLMWFDRMDPRDPLKLTNGVYGVRFKYNFADNSIFWIWGLYGNNETKGYELFPTEKNIPEFGSRLQLPAFFGELAATFHTRRVIVGSANFRENRYAIDGRWDLGFGIWFESALWQNITDLIVYKWNKTVTIGSDYTLPIGNGIFILGEHLVTSLSNSFWKSDLDRQVSALMVSYPIGVFDNLLLLEFYDWDKKNLYQNLQLQRTYDNLIINLSLFHYPEEGSNIFMNSKTINLGYGFQLMLIFNY